MRILTVLVVLAAALTAFFLLRGLQDSGTDQPDVLPRPAHPGPADRRVRAEPADDTPSAIAGSSHDASPSRAPGIAVPGGVVRGLVVDGRGRGIAGAEVRLDALDASTIRGAPVRAEASLVMGRTESDGTFTLPLEARRWVRVVARAEGYGTTGTRVPGPGAYVELTLHAGGTVDVEVLGEDGSGVAGADVVLMTRDARHGGTTADDGHVRFQGVAPGLVRVDATAGGLREGRATPTTCLPGAVTRLQVLLPRSVRLAGRIVDRGTGQPVADAEVHLARPGLAVSAGPTRGDGTFGPVAAGTPGVQIVVAVRAPGYAPTVVPALVPDTEEVHVLDVSLERAVAWSGTVTDGAGGPVAGARVGYTAAGIAGREPPATTTGEDGRFHLPPPSPPAPGRRVVLVAEHGGRTAAYAPGPGEEPPPDIVLVLARGAEVTGRVVEAGGRPRDGLIVRLDPRWRGIRDPSGGDPDVSNLRAMNERGRLALTTATDAEGWWRLVDVPNATYDVRLLAPGGATLSAATLTVSGTDVDLGVLKTGTGHELSGRAIDDAGRPLAGVEVTARDARGPRVRTTTGVDGAWRFTDLAGGEWTLAATRPERLPARATVAVPTAEPIDLVLGAGARLAGRVLDAGHPFSKPFTLILESEGARRRSRLRRTVRDAAGRFSMDGLAAGYWQVRVETPKGRGAALAAAVEVRPGATFEVELELAAGARLTGRLHTPSGAPATDARVTLTHEETGRRRRASVGTGTWRAGGLPAGTWHVTARGRGGAPVEATASLAAGQEAELDLVLAPIGRLEVTVAGPDGKIRPKAYVTVRPAAGPSPAWRRPPRTDDDGHVVLPFAPTGRLDVIARTPAGESGRTQVTVGEGATHRVTVTVRPAADDSDGR